ncbi:hypothetical protein M409DRAFT_25257 [Zasmidium cellare ATCC 36951]|uniref:DUF1746 domain-containing protein n=1 Tax=Zasmidium cellare ATCC 36951 TaxID=1080233 RepID=A0A6A6CFC8_ZASCE|nr:uncharacterized protein M409DRAFT_25257 [Zasmidium cellare ATCC 36951]KAF2164379.1 hypothetical protein M409DRAFT_25257 [Zasmidium cellare ATCC 36951]
MNDEPSTSAQPAQDDIPPAPHALPSAKQIEERRKKNRENFNKRRGELLDDLIKSVDLLVYAELSTIYYMDCSFLTFLLRAVVQLIWLTPKPAMFPEPPPNRPYIGMIFGTNILCLLLHMWSSAPSAGEATRGYLHGGMAMDFIGQKGPSSKLHLLLLDLLVVLLQTVHLSVLVLRQRLRQSPAIAVTTSTGSQYPAQPTSTGQTVEDEERGVRRSVEQENRDAIEMQTLNPAGTAAESTQTTNEEASSEQEALLASTSMPQHTDARIFDAFNSGQIVLGDFDLLKTVKEQFLAYQKAPRDANLAEANRLMRERLAARMLRWRFEAPTVMGRTVG